MEDIKGLNYKPLEFSDFSGGMTENILQGDPRRYAKAQNYLITTDKKLEVRPGLVIDGETSYYIPGEEGLRVNGYHSVLNESELLPQVSSKLYYKDPVNKDWNPIPGVAGNNTLSYGDLNSQTTLSEFQRQIYLATDAPRGTLPSKIYKNDLNQWVAKTAGLPRSWVTGAWTEESLLIKCLENANAIRESMILHFKDAKYATYQFPMSYETAAELHINIDRYSLSYFESVSFGPDPNIPDPLPTPLGPATDKTSLFDLVDAMNLAYAHHTQDAMINSWGTRTDPPVIIPGPPYQVPIYHQDPPVLVAGLLQKTKGPAAPLNAQTKPTTVEQAATMLDDLWQKWNWHRLAVNTHDVDNNPAVIDVYAPLGTKIGPVQMGSQAVPTVTPDWGDLLAYVNNLKFLYNAHVLNFPGISFLYGVHKSRDNNIYNQQYVCPLPNCDDLDSMFLLIWWLRSLYRMHVWDAELARAEFVTVDSTSGSPDITDIRDPSNGVLVQISNSLLGTPWFFHFALGSFSMFDPFPATNSYPGVYQLAQVMDSASGTATINRNATSAQDNVGAQISPSQYHSALEESSNLPGLWTFVGTQTSKETANSVLSTDVTTYGNSTKSWLALANDLFFAMANHMQNPAIHIGGNLNITGYQRLVNEVPNQPFFVPQIAEVAYAFFYSDRYTVEPDGLEYLTQSNPVFTGTIEVAVSNPLDQEIPNLYPDYYTAKKPTVERGNLITNLPKLTNTSFTNYDLNNSKLNIYRTTDGGTVFFELAEVDNGTTSYLDIINDSRANPGDTPLSVRQTIYTNGGVVGHSQPPECKFTHESGGYVYWGAVRDGEQFLPNRIVQGIPNTPDAAPASFFIDLPDEVVGISSSRGKVIAFCKNSLYRLEGNFTITGQGLISYENIGDTLGCLNTKSIVQTEIGVFFAATNGFYYTDGYQVIPLTLELKNTYAALTQSETQKRAIYGGYDKMTRRVWWSLREGPTAAQNSILYTFYLDYGVKPSGTFTTMSNGLNFRPSSLVFQNGILHVGDERGYLLKSDIYAKTDALIDTDEVASDWYTKYIPYDFTTSAIDLGTIINRKWTSKFHLVGKNVGNASIQPYVIRDVNEYNQGAVPMAPINYKQNLVWGDPTLVWGDPSCVWKTDGKMDVWRRFPAKNLRSDFIQVQLKPAFVCVYSSSVGFPEFAWCTASNSTKVVTIETPTGFTAIVWPLDVVGYFLRLSIDDYTTEWEIIDVDDDELTVHDPDDLLPDVSSPGVRWEIWGVKKEQRHTITSMAIVFAYVGQSQQKYPGAFTNDGPGNGGENP